MGKTKWSIKFEFLSETNKDPPIKRGYGVKKCNFLGFVLCGKQYYKDENMKYAKVMKRNCLIWSYIIGYYFLSIDLYEQ